MKCIVCGSRETKLIYKDMAWYEKWTFFDIYNCKTCNSNFMDWDNIDYSIYDKIYSNEDKMPWYDRYARYFNEIKKQSDKLEYLCNEEWITIIIRDYLHSLGKNKKEISILEVGCGLWYTTYALNEDWYNCIWLDISENSIKKAKTMFWERLYFVWDANKLWENKDFSWKYDLVFSTEVIEHISDVSWFIDNIFKFVKPWGAVILTTPNKDFMPKKCIRSWDRPTVHTCLIWLDFFNRYCKERDLKYSVYNYNTNIMNKNMLLENMCLKLLWKFRHKKYLNTSPIDFNNLLHIQQFKKSFIYKIYRFLLKNKVCVRISNFLMKIFNVKISSTLWVIITK